MVKRFYRLQRKHRNLTNLPFSKAVRELPAIKYAKRLANQVQSEVRFLENGANWFGKYTKLVNPNDDTGTEEDKRYYLETVRDGHYWLIFFSGCLISSSYLMSS